MVEREQKTKTFPFPHKNDKVGEGKGRTTWCTERGEYKRGWEGAVLTGAQDKMKVLLTTYSQKELIFLEFPWNFPIITYIPFSVHMLKIRSFPSSSFNRMTKKYFYLHL